LPIAAAVGLTAAAALSIAAEHARSHAATFHAQTVHPATVHPAMGSRALTGGEADTPAVGRPQRP
jgi:hypothetical protein